MGAYNTGRFLFFFNDTATTEIYTLSLHDALPIYFVEQPLGVGRVGGQHGLDLALRLAALREMRSEEHTYELQSLQYFVWRLVLEKKDEKHQGHLLRVRFNQHVVVLLWRRSVRSVQ